MLLISQSSPRVKFIYRIHLIKNPNLGMEDTLEHPVALCPKYVTKSPTMLILQQHDTTWSKRDFTCFRADSNLLFNIVGRPDSSSRRRELIDADTGAPLFELRRRDLSFEEIWSIDFSTNEAPTWTGHFSAAVKWKGLSSFHVKLNNQAAEGVRVVLEVRARPGQHVTFDVNYDGAKIMEVRKIPSCEAPEDSARFRSRPAWEIDVAAGVDLTLVSTYGGCALMIGVRLTPNLGHSDSSDYDRNESSTYIFKK